MINYLIIKSKIRPYLKNLILNKSSSILPDGYKQVKYIESTGTQYIDTGVPMSDIVQLNGKFAFTSINDIQGFFGRYSSQQTTIQSLANNLSNTINFRWLSINSSIPLDTNKHSFSMSNRRTVLDDVVKNTYNLGKATDNDTLLLMARRTDGSGSGIQNYSYLKLYSFKIYKDSGLVRNLVPAIKKSNGNQLFDYTRTDGIIANKYINQAGVIVSGANDYYISYPISVTQGETYTWRFNADSISTTHTAPTVGFYDNNDNLISVAQHAIQVKYFSFTVPSNCAYIRCSVYTVNNAQEQAMLNKGARPLRYEAYIPDEVGMYDLSATSMNLANLHNINKTSLSLNFKTGDNMTIVVNGTKASGANVIAIANPNIMLPAGTYTIKIKMIDGTISNITGGAIFGINASTYAMRTSPQVNKVGDIGTRTFTLAEDTLLTSLDITPSYGDVGSVWNNATFECWLYSGSDDVPYEPYQKRFYTNDGTGEFLYK